MIGRRILAFWLDCALAIFLTSVGLYLLRREILANTDVSDFFNPVRGWAGHAFHPLAFPVGMFLYFLIFVGAFSETPGMSLFGLTLVRSEGEGVARKKAGVRRSVIRVFLFFVTVATCGAGFLTVFLNDRRMALHDCLSGTRVVRARSFVSPKRANPS